MKLLNLIIDVICLAPFVIVAAVYLWQTIKGTETWD